MENGVGLWRGDVGAIILDYFQMYAMLLLLAGQGGTFPESLFKKTYFTLIANLDFWGFYEHANYDIDESQPRASSFVTDAGVGLSYYLYIGFWTAVPPLIALAYVIAQRIFKVDDELKWKRRACLQPSFPSSSSSYPRPATPARIPAGRLLVWSIGRIVGKLIQSDALFCARTLTHV